MSRPALVTCQGAPRDLGLDQGKAARERVRREVSGARTGFASSLAHRFRPDPLVRRVDRDAARHYPHMAERLDGLSRGARVSRLDLAALLARELIAPSARELSAPSARELTAPSAREGVSLAVAPERTPGGAIVAVAPERTPGGAIVAVAVSSVEDLVLRRSRPDNDYESLELVHPWLVPPLAGINVHGFAAAVTALGDGSPGVGDCAAPASLLVQDCLQRFDRVDKAVEWCAGRPSGGSFALLLGDALGSVARVCVTAGDCRVDWPADGLLLALGSESQRAALEKSCAAQRQLDPTALRAGLRGVGAAGAALVLLDPAGARLGFWEGDAGEPEWLPAPGSAPASTSHEAAG